MSEEYVWVKVAEGRERLVPKGQAAQMSALAKVRGAHGARGLGGAKVHLSAAERKSIERLTGVKVFDAQDARRALKATGMRFLERGEELDETLQRQAAGESVPFPGWDRLGVLPQVGAFNFEERLRFHEARERESARREGS